MGKLRKQCTAAEYARYAQAYLATWDCLSGAIRYLAVKAEDHSLLPPERLEIERELTRLRAERSALEAARQGFRANKKTISPPSSQTVKAAEKLADDIDRAIRDATNFEGMISVTDKALELFSTIRAA